MASLITARLELFVSVAVILKPYLEIFQSHTPLLPFITSELQSSAGNYDGEICKQTGT